MAVRPTQTSSHLRSARAELDVHAEGLASLEEVGESTGRAARSDALSSVRSGPNAPFVVVFEWFGDP